MTCKDCIHFKDLKYYAGLGNCIAPVPKVVLLVYTSYQASLNQPYVVNEMMQSDDCTSFSRKEQ